MKLPRMFRSARRQVADDITLEQLLVLLRVAEKIEARAEQRAREIGDPAPDWDLEYEAASEARHVAWMNAEDVRHELDRYLHPRRYAARGILDKALDQYRAVADSMADDRNAASEEQDRGLQADTPAEDYWEGSWETDREIDQEEGWERDRDAFKCTFPENETGPWGPPGPWRLEPQEVDAADPWLYAEPDRTTQAQAEEEREAG